MRNPTIQPKELHITVSKYCFNQARIDKGRKVLWCVCGEIIHISLLVNPTTLGTIDAGDCHIRDIIIQRNI
jgi:hypothetical protein